MEYKVMQKLGLLTYRLTRSGVFIKFTFLSRKSEHVDHGFFFFLLFLSANLSYFSPSNA